MKTIKKDWLTWILLLIPFIFIAMNWKHFPTQIATHFKLDGTPDDYSGKAFGLFFLPALNIGMYLLFIALPAIDPSGKNFAVFADKYKIIRVLLHVFILFIFFLTAFYSLGYHFNFSGLIMYGTLFFFLIFGNYMGTVRHNYFIGIRTPWTLANEVVWTRTHRFASKIWVFASLIMMIIMPFISDRDTLFGIYIGVIALIPTVYSYVIFRKLKSAHEH